MSVLLVVAVCIFTLFGQSNFWPDALTIPLEDEAVDSNVLGVSGNQNIEMNIYQTAQLIFLSRSDSIKSIEQSCSYKLSNDHGLGVENHYLDLSGSIARKNFPFEFSSIGLEWMPAVVLNRSKSSSNGIGSIRLGPTIGINYLGLPIHFSGGGAVDVWQNELPYYISNYHLSGFQGDPGFYGGIQVGDYSRPLVQNIPFYAEGKIYGTYMANSKITNGEVNMLFVKDIPFADKLFIYGVDTLSKGRTAYFKELAGGITQYTSTDNRTMNSMQATCALKGIGRFFLKPSLMYSFSLSSVTYPDPNDFLGDEMLASNVFYIMLDSDSLNFINYNSGISFNFDKEDWLFNNDFLSHSEITEENEDSLIENSKDYKGFNVRMFHILGKEFKNKMGFTYTIDINRYQKIFPNCYYYIPFDGSEPDTIVREDNDKVNYRHIFDLTLFSSPRLKITAIGEYIKNMRVFLRKEKSINNQTNRIYLCETSFDINPQGNVILKETLGAIGKNSEYHFPEARVQNNDPLPLMSRRFYSKLNSNWRIKERLLINLFWNEIYWDDGYWDAEIYRDTLLSDVGKDYYAIENKSLETSLELACSFHFNEYFQVGIGNFLQNIYDWNWNYKEGYYEEPQKHCYNILMKPFIEMSSLLFNRVTVDARIKCHSDLKIDTNTGEDRYRYDISIDYWEAASSINMEF